MYYGMVPKMDPMDHLMVICSKPIDFGGHK